MRPQNQLLTALSLLLLAACSPKEQPTAANPEAAPAATPKPAPAPAKTTVNISLFSWPGYGFWFIAKEKNLVPELALDIQIIEDPYESFGQMAAGKLDVTSSTVEYGPIAADQGVPVKLVAYTNPSYGTDKIILAPGVTGAADLVGKEVAVLEGGSHPDLHGHLAREQRRRLRRGEIHQPHHGRRRRRHGQRQGRRRRILGTLRQQRPQGLPEAKVVATSKDPYFKKTALLGDGMYMSGPSSRKRSRHAHDEGLLRSREVLEGKSRRGQRDHRRRTASSRRRRVDSSSEQMAAPPTAASIPSTG
jgi:hypothetical protein